MIFLPTDDLAHNILLLIPYVFKKIIKGVMGDDIISAHQFFVLSVLKARRSVNMTACSDVLSLSKSNMTALVDRLVKDGYVLRVTHEKDRRVIMLQITTRGEELVKELGDHYLKRLRERLEMFCEEDKKRLNDHVASIMKIMNDYAQSIEELK